MLRRCASTTLTTTLTLVAAAFLAGTIFSPPPAAASDVFDDVTSAGYGPAIDALVEEGVVNGCAEADFCPDEALTRGQMATLLTEALGLPYEGSGFFADVDDTAHAVGVNSLAAAGITRGCSAIDFCPEDPITRGQLASLLARGFEPEPTETVAFDGIGGVHEDAINRLAEAGITAGCSDSLVEFCPDDPVLRWEAALFVARSMDLVERVELSALDERRDAQAEIDAEEQRRLEEEQALLEQQRLEEERVAQQQAERNQVWDRLAQCEAGGNWSINTGNGYYGGLQFSLGSWQAVGGTGYPHQNSRAEQILRAEKLLAIQGWGAWPACSLKLGLR